MHRDQEWDAVWVPMYNRSALCSLEVMGMKHQADLFRGLVEGKGFDELRFETSTTSRKWHRLEASLENAVDLDQATDLGNALGLQLRIHAGLSGESTHASCVPKGSLLAILEEELQPQLRTDFPPFFKVRLLCDGSACHGELAARSIITIADDKVWQAFFINATTTTCCDEFIKMCDSFLSLLQLQNQLFNKMCTVANNLRVAGDSRVQRSCA